MRVLLACLHFGLVRNFESVVAELAARGHEAILACEESDGYGGDALVAALANRTNGVRMTRVPSVLDDPAVDLGQRLRLVLDSLRFQHDEFREFAKLRDRMAERLPYFAQRVDLRNVPGAWRVLEQIERGIPVNQGLRRWLNDERPDVVLFASLTHGRSVQPDLLRAAITDKIPTIACVYSWDHLSSKAHIIDVPDRIVVWNDVQKHEAVRLHGLPADRVTTTGAQCYDQWFDSRPSRDRETFCRDMGLDPSRPYVLYTCSALTPSPDEPAFVLQWIDCVRRSNAPALRDVGVLLRPHPERLHEWNGKDYSQLENVAFRPRTDDVDEARRDYLDALHHSAAVVGVVTSAFLEAAIIGRPVLTPMLPVFAAHQWGMQHFRYLLEVEDGLPIIGKTLDEHLQQLERVLSGDQQWKARQERFLAAFVRAGQLAERATPRFADVVEQVGAAASRGYRREPGMMGRAVATVAIRLARSPRLRPWLYDDAERQNDRRKAWEEQNRRNKEHVRDARYAEKERQQQERERRWREKQQERARLKQERYRLKRQAQRRQRIGEVGWHVVARVKRVLSRS